MTTIMRAVWDGKVFVPVEPVDLPVNVPLELTMIATATPSVEPTDGHVDTSQQVAPQTDERA